MNNHHISIHTINSINCRHWIPSSFQLHTPFPTQIITPRLNRYLSTSIKVKFKKTLCNYSLISFCINSFNPTAKVYILIHVFSFPYILFLDKITFFPFLFLLLLQHFIYLLNHSFLLYWFSSLLLPYRQHQKKIILFHSALF